ncbi:hypothetical protein DL765_011022 [Monosporascus sp. GIB2]|nr:hypothetical protein DL765_011022 [Monosporascus sp. GIB2]
MVMTPSSVTHLSALCALLSLQAHAAPHNWPRGSQGGAAMQGRFGVFREEPQASLQRRGGGRGDANQPPGPPVHPGLSSPVVGTEARDHPRPEGRGELTIIWPTGSATTTTSTSTTAAASLFFHGNGSSGGTAVYGLGSSSSSASAGTSSGVSASFSSRSGSRLPPPNATFPAVEEEACVLATITSILTATTATTAVRTVYVTWTETVTAALSSAPPLPWGPDDGVGGAYDYGLGVAPGGSPPEREPSVSGPGLTVTITGVSEPIAASTAGASVTSLGLPTFSSAGTGWHNESMTTITRTRTRTRTRTTTVTRYASQSSGATAATGSASASAPSTVRPLVDPAVTASASRSKSAATATAALTSTCSTDSSGTSLSLPLSLPPPFSSSLTATVSTPSPSAPTTAAQPSAAPPLPLSVTSSALPVSATSTPARASSASVSVAVELAPPDISATAIITGTTTTDAVVIATLSTRVVRLNLRPVGAGTPTTATRSTAASAP